MKKLNLMLHCGANATDREGVRNSFTPPATETHQPVAHHDFLKLVTENLTRQGLEVVSEAHGLRTPKRRGDKPTVIDAQYFGMFEVRPVDGSGDHDDFSMILGMRNSHDKTFPAGIALGSGVFVCDNLAFSAEEVIKTRHTVHVYSRIGNLVSKAIGRLTAARTTQEQRIEAYKETTIDDRWAKSLILDAAIEGAINQQRILPALEQWQRPNHEEFAPRTLWSLFNGFTEVLKGKDGNHLATLPDRTQKLHNLMDLAAGLQIADLRSDDDVEVVRNGQIV